MCAYKISAALDVDNYNLVKANSVYLRAVGGWCINAVSDCGKLTYLASTNLLVNGLIEDDKSGEWDQVHDYLY